MLTPGHISIFKNTAESPLETDTCQIFLSINASLNP